MSKRNRKPNQRTAPDVTQYSQVIVGEKCELRGARGEFRKMSHRDAKAVLHAMTHGEHRWTVHIAVTYFKGARQCMDSVCVRKNTNEYMLSAIIESVKDELKLTCEGDVFKTAIFATVANTDGDISDEQAFTVYNKMGGWYSGRKGQFMSNFSEEQLSILDFVQPWVDSQYASERKGQCQYYPIIRVRADDEYYCEKESVMKTVPDSLVGVWMLEDLLYESQLEWKVVRLGDDWVKVEYKSVSVMRWVPTSQT